MRELNVNLKTGRCGPEPHCQHDNTPLLVPAPVPSTFLVQVRLAACDCFHRGPDGQALPPPTWVHTSTCAGLPMLATCTIATPDGSWANSAVVKVDWQVRNERGDWCPSPMTHEQLVSVTRIAQERWAVVVALLLGRSDFLIVTGTKYGTLLTGLLEERDEVFAAVADMVRHEEGAVAAQERALKRLPRRPSFIHRPRSWRPEEVPSASALAEYIHHLLGQVRELSPAP